MQSFFAGLAASGTATSALRMVTKAAFENSRDGLRKGACEIFISPVCIYLRMIMLYHLVEATIAQLICL